MDMLQLHSGRIKARKHSDRLAGSTHCCSGCNRDTEMNVSHGRAGLALNSGEKKNLNPMYCVEIEFIFIFKGGSDHLHIVKPFARKACFHFYIVLPENKNIK